MEPFLIENGIAAPMLAANIDTDVIMPKQFLMGINREGLDKGVFYDQRYLKSGDANPDFILNKNSWKNTNFLVVGENFGCGSSREHAVWGLKQIGIKALIGTTFAGIFYDNCKRNGVLTIQLSSEEIKLLGEVVSQGNSNQLVIDLPSQLILFEGQQVISFDIDPINKQILMQGLDAIGQTLQRFDQIQKFEKQYLEENSWLD